MSTLRVPGNYTSSHLNSFNKTFNFDNHSHLTDKFSNSLRIDFDQFKSLLETISQKMVPDYPPSLAFVEILKSFLIPHLST